jgi:hypothetical protein
MTKVGPFIFKSKQNGEGDPGIIVLSAVGPHLLRIIPSLKLSFGFLSTWVSGTVHLSIGSFQIGGYAMIFI